MLQRANDDLRDSALAQQEELEEWKVSSERLSASLSRKDNEITTLTEQLQEARDKVRFHQTSRLSVWMKKSPQFLLVLCYKRSDAWFQTLTMIEKQTMH